MGLDMYLIATREFNPWEFDPRSKGEKDLIKSIKQIIPIVNEHETLSLSTTAIYWRKVNAVHGWFVDNVQNGLDDCETYPVSVDDLKRLKEACDRVVDDPSCHMEVLPPRGGFFFGDTVCNDRYIVDLRTTSEQLEEILSNPDCDKWNYSYESSW